MKTGRLITQLEELKQYENRLLVIEGIDEQDLYNDTNVDLEDGKPIGMHPNSIRGFSSFDPSELQDADNIH